MQVGYRAHMMVTIIICGGERAAQQVYNPPGGSPTSDLWTKEVAQRQQYTARMWLMLTGMCKY